MHAANIHDQKERSRLSIQLKMPVMEEVLVRAPKNKKTEKKEKGISVEEICESLEEDISAIIRLRSKAVTADDIGYIAQSLESFVSRVQEIDDKNDKQKINLFLSIFKVVFEQLLEQHQTDKPLQSAIISAKKKCDAMTSIIASIPMLNKKVPLPDDDDLPLLYRSTTCKKWAKTEWDNPGRSKEQKVEFFQIIRDVESGKSKKVSSARQHLFT